jgi:hypothetical protein
MLIYIAGSILKHCIDYAADQMDCSYEQLYTGNVHVSCTVCQKDE